MPQHTRRIPNPGAPALDAEQLLMEAERLRAQVSELEQRNRDLLEGSIQGVIVVRGNHIIFCNAALAGMFGYPDPAAVLEMGKWSDLLAPSEVERLNAYSFARLRGETAPAR